MSRICRKFRDDMGEEHGAQGSSSRLLLSTGEGRQANRASVMCVPTDGRPGCWENPKEGEPTVVHSLLLGALCPRTH